VTVAAFTGTRLGLTALQRDALRTNLYNASTRPHVLMHGDCIGADAEASELAASLRIITIACPCDLEDQRAHRTADVILPARPPLARNRWMVDGCDFLIACPPGPEVRRSGTWSTVRYAERVRRPVVIIWPDGHVEARP
jgi:hypothetical protein